jgi:hypothetical protein
LDRSAGPKLRRGPTVLARYGPVRVSPYVVELVGVPHDPHRLDPARADVDREHVRDTAVGGNQEAAGLAVDRRSPLLQSPLLEALRVIATMKRATRSAP